jgi:hypothetical protein
VKLTLERVQLSPDCTIGSLSIDGTWQCWTLEDVVRDDGVKVAGETAIPFGAYNVDITWSPRFKRSLPLLLNVAGFVGVRIHPGNTTDDTEGCVLVGMDRHPKSIGRSRLAFDALFAKLRDAKARGEAIALEIVR